MDEAYVKGFNEGYVIATHLPELAEVLATTKGASTWLEGFHAGCFQYVLEQAQERKGRRRRARRHDAGERSRELESST